MPCISYIVKENLSLRLDRFISENLKLLTRSQIKTRNLKAVLNGKEVKLSHFVKQGDILELNWDDLIPSYIIPQDIPLEVIYEDERCIVINKEQGMVVHPGAGNRQGTLANALFFRKQIKNELINISLNNDYRPGIVHRLDKETSGVIIAAWDEQALLFLCEQFKTRKVKKNYIAIVCGSPKERKGCIETFIARDPKNRKRFTVSPNGKRAITFYKVIKKWQDYSLLLLRPKTGRTHQLRVHLRHLGTPILGDAVYGFKDTQFPEAAMMLHSKRLEIILPGQAEKSVFKTDVPMRFLSVIEKLNKKEGAHG
ncbi:MAG: RluA family pseudouridine synthase [Treponema sp.]|nr:RluA family pseudouridine synthase [Treponema sp.]MCL2251338.1 RluA family pseudouridine synthase [Treponema sp.]